MREQRAGGAPAWFVPFGDAAHARLRLYCFPFAGGGARAFRSWPDRLPDDIAVVGIRLPGRESRVREAPYEAWPDLLESLAEALAAEAPQGPYALFGHSLGARIAYESTHRLAVSGVRLPETLAISACPAPTTPPRWPRIYDLDRDSLRERLRALDGIPTDILENDVIFRVFEPVLRADLKLADVWQPTRNPVDVPIAAFCGEQDEVAPCPDMAAWAQQTRSAFARRTFPGGHFFLRSAEAEVVDTLASLIADRVGAAR